MPFSSQISAGTIVEVLDPNGQVADQDKQVGVLRPQTQRLAIEYGQAPG